MIAPDYFDRFQVNTTRDRTCEILAKEHALSEAEVEDALAKIDLLVSECHQALKVAIQA